MTRFVTCLMVSVCAAALLTGTASALGPQPLSQPANCTQYPIKITTPGSYQLVGNLNLAALRCDKTAIEVNADNVTIDLNGFSIIGPCEVLTCNTDGVSDGHHGIDATDHNISGAFGKGHHATTVLNGTVRDMGDDGVHLGNDGIIKDVRAINNKGEGIQCGEGCIVSGVVANGNGTVGSLGGGTGIEVDDSGLVINSVAQGNVSDGITCDSANVSVINSVAQSIVTCNNTGGNVIVP